jgi:hypothetical protein
MTDGGKLRIGIDGARELAIEVDDIDDAVSTVEKGLGSASPLIWLTDRQAGRHGIVAARVAFVEVERASDRSVGFG